MQYFSRRLWVVFLFVLAVGCAPGYGPVPMATVPPAVTEVPTATPSETAPTGGEALVSIADFSFQPDGITIPVGTTVIWEHEDSAPHTVTADDGTFDSGTFRRGGTFQFTFSAPGTYTYHCEIHPSLTGTVVVTG